MSKLNILAHINAYSDENNTNSPTLSNVKWVRQLLGITISEPESHSVQLPAGESLTLFSGTVSTSDDATTTWDIAPKSGSSNTYVLSHNAGTAPAFKTARTSGADATTEITVTKNAKLLTFTSTGGTVFALVANGVVVGDKVRIDDDFNSLNQGEYTILAVTATSFTVENELGAAEGPITPGADFATQVNIYSSAGVQIGDKIDITANFSSVSFGTFDITDVSHDYIEFYCTDSLPTETGVSNNPSAFSIYRDAKQFLYVESDKKLDITLNSSATPNQIVPVSIGISSQPGIFMNNSSIKSAVITNQSSETASVFYITAE